MGVQLRSTASTASPKFSIPCERVSAKTSETALRSCAIACPHVSSVLGGWMLGFKLYAADTALLLQG